MSSLCRAHHLLARGKRGFIHPAVCWLTIGEFYTGNRKFPVFRPQTQTLDQICRAVNILAAGVWAIKEFREVVRA